MFLAAARNGPQTFRAKVIRGFGDRIIVVMDVGHENLEWRDEFKVARLMLERVKRRDLEPHRLTFII
jgi:hypothetical protein